MEREGFIAALLPICDFVCEYDRRREKLRVRRSEIAPELAGSRWYTVDTLSDALRSKGSIIAERGAWVHYLTNDNLRRFFTEQPQDKSFRLRFRQSGMGYRQYDVRIDLVDSNTLVISGRDTQAQEVDALTGALNRSHYERDMAGEIFNGGVAIIDMDDLKLFNDLYGHGAGDAALRTIAEVVHAVVGERSSLVRYGGDEFLLLVPQITESEFNEQLSKIQRQLHSVCILACGQEQHPTASIGCVIAEQETVSSAVQRADRLMYRAKRTKDAVVTESSPVENTESGKEKILVVDDSALNRQLLREMLEEDFTILESANGSECMEQLFLHGSEIALVLLDMIMPVMDGLQVLEEMNRQGLIDRIPVIVITADGSEDHVRQAYDMGVVDYIERPFDIKVVRQRTMNTVKLYARQRRLMAVMAQQLHRQEHTVSVAANVFSRVMGYRNGEGMEHGRHVQLVTERLLYRLMERTDKYAFTHRECRRIAAAGMFHDVGKMGVPDTLLRKPGPLTPEEFDVVKTHTTIGENLLRSMKDYTGEPLVGIAADICRWHHERADGRGYPDGLQGDEIPISAQVVGLADAYDALVSRRAYKDAFSPEKAMDMIRRGECGAFDPLLVECLQDIQDALRHEVYTAGGAE